LFHLDGDSFIGRSALYLANSSARRGISHSDILHHTFYHPRFLRPDFAGPRVTTIYDMTPDLFPELFPEGDPHLSKRAYVDASDMLLCISDSTRQDLIAVYGELDKPIRIAHLGVSQTFSPHHLPIDGLPARYLLFVGKRDKYKDYSVLAEAVAGLEEKVVLVVVGGGAFTDEEIHLHERLGITPQIRQLSVGDQELAGLYANTLAFVFPSRYEGFGLPTLEAMASGAPTILAMISAHPEIGGDAAMYFPPGDAAVLRDCLERVIGDPALREQYGSLGIARAAAFTWEQTARQTSDAYHELF
jgi:glycosyltransferase involved in cell wall biosynthesis